MNEDYTICFYFRVCVVVVGGRVCGHDLLSPTSIKAQTAAT